MPVIRKHIETTGYYYKKWQSIHY